MIETIVIPAELARLTLPVALQTRLQELLDCQDSGDQLSSAERDEAAGLVELSEFLSTPRSRSTNATNDLTRHIPAGLRDLVVERAANRGEYCELAQAGQAATFHVDHVVPLAVGGPTIADNLALACVSCSLRKGARQAVVDPASTGKRLALLAW